MITELHKLAKALVKDAIEVYTERYWCEEDGTAKPCKSTPQEKAEVERWVFPSQTVEFPLSFDDACEHSQNDAARIRILLKRMRAQREGVSE